MTTETARVEAFSDGVFAVAITLLILEIKVPGYEGDLGAKLLLQWPSYLAFVTSFAFIGVMWINHHRLFTHIRKSDDMLLVLNLALMFSVCIVPFTTALLAAHLGHTGARTATVAYDSAYLGVALFFNLLWRYAASRDGHLLATDVNREIAGRITQQYNYGPVAYAIAIALAWISIPASLLINLVLAFFFALPPRYAVKQLPERRREFS
ncbi:MAG: TMEM175 family protein [Candidatus Korobacteraceae bacterium]